MSRLTAPRSYLACLTLAAVAAACSDAPTATSRPAPSAASAGRAPESAQAEVLTGLRLSPSIVYGGQTSVATVTLDAPAPAGGRLVVLRSSDGAASVPSSVVVDSGSTTASFEIHTHVMPWGVTVTISAAAGVYLTAPLRVNATPGSPSFVVSPDSIPFGRVQVGGTSLAQQVVVLNTGSGAGTVGTPTTTGDFTVVQNYCPVAPTTLYAGASCTMWVAFRPTAAGPRTGTLTIPTNAAGGALAVPLSGNGWIPAPDVSVIPGSLGFGSVQLGTATSGRVVKVTSTGDAPVSVSAVGLGGANPGDFLIATDDCTGRTLSPGAYCTVLVSFEPTRVGTRSATLTVQNSGVAGARSVALSGAGVTPRGGVIP
jgi:hypothetical protein